MDQQNPLTPITPQPVIPTPPAMQPAPTPPQKHKIPGWTIAVIAVLAAVIVIGGVAAFLMMNGNKQNSSQSNNGQSSNVQTDTTPGADESPINQSSSLTIPELSVKIADPENRGLTIYYDDYGKTACQANKNYYTNNGCENYLNSTHCEDKNINSEGICSYYIYDNETYNSSKNTTATNATQYYPCGSDLTIYEIAKDKMKAATDMTADVTVGSKTISLWAHGSMNGECDTAAAAKADAYIKDLLQYVKKNLSAL